MRRCGDRIQNPASVFSAKYATIFVPGAIDPDISISSIASPSRARSVPRWDYSALPTETADTPGVFVSLVDSSNCSDPWD